MKDAITPILLVVLIGMVMFSTAMVQENTRETNVLLRQMLEGGIVSVQDESSEPEVALSAPTPTVPPTAAADTTPEPMPTTLPEADPVVTARVDPEPAPQPQPVEVVVELDPEPVTAPVVVDGHPEWSTYGPAVEQVIGDLLSGEYDAAAARFDDEFRQVLPTSMLAQVMDPIRNQHGSMVEVLKHEAPQSPIPDNLQAFKVNVKTERGEPLMFHVTMDQAQQVAGLYVQ